MRRFVGAVVASTVVGLAVVAAPSASASAMIVYTGLVGRRPTLMAVAPDGSRPHKLVDGANGTISRDGSRLVFADGHGIAASKADGSHRRYLTRDYNASSTTEIVVSPNGRRVAYVAQHGLNKRSPGDDKPAFLFLADTVSGAQHQIYSEPLGAGPFLGNLTWSADSRQLAFETWPARDGTVQLAVANAATGAVAQITHNVLDGTICSPPAATQTFLQTPAWGPKGLAVFGQVYVCTAGRGGGPATWESSGPSPLPPSKPLFIDAAGKIQGPAPAGGRGAWSPDGSDLVGFSTPLTYSHGLAVEGIAVRASGPSRRLGSLKAVYFAPLSWGR